MNRNIIGKLAACWCLSVLSAGLILVAQPSQSQVAIYSANTLIASFSKQSAVSLKGVTVTVTDVVAETKPSEIIFKNVGNDKVICDLGRSLHLVVDKGQRVTVIGRVKGRGILGNVTLEQCRIFGDDGNVISNDGAATSTTAASSAEPKASEESPTDSRVADLTVPPEETASQPQPSLSFGVADGVAQPPVRSDPKTDGTNLTLPSAKTDVSVGEFAFWVIRTYWLIFVVWAIVDIGGLVIWQKPPIVSLLLTTALLAFRILGYLILLSWIRDYLRKKA